MQMIPSWCDLSFLDIVFHISLAIHQPVDEGLTNNSVMLFSRYLAARRCARSRHEGRLPFKEYAHYITFARAPRVLSKASALGNDESSILTHLINDVEELFVLGARGLSTVLDTQLSPVIVR